MPLFKSRASDGVVGGYFYEVVTLQLDGKRATRGIGLLEERYSVISEAKSARLRSHFRAFYPHEVCVPTCENVRFSHTLIWIRITE